MRLIDIGLKNRMVTILIFLVLIISGIFGLMSMPRYEDPQHKNYNCVITSIYPGATSQQVEALVTKPLEEKINELNEIKCIESISTNGVSNIMVLLFGDADREKVWDKLNEKVKDAQENFPSGAEVLEVDYQLIKINATIYHLIAPSGQSATVLQQICEGWAESLQRVSGVEKVEISGIPGQQVQIILDSAQMTAREISWLDIANALQKRNVIIPGGNLREGQLNLVVETSSQYQSLKEIEDTVISQTQQGAVIRIKDVAKVKIGLDKTDSHRRDKWSAQCGIGGLS